MLYKDKLIRNINHSLWNKFVGKCISEEIKVSEKIMQLIKKDLGICEEKEIKFI